VVINLVATCGQGEWPGNSRTFWDEISDENLPSDFLNGVKFATFGMVGVHNNIRYIYVHILEYIICVCMYAGTLGIC